MKAALTALIATSLLSATTLANSFESQHRVGLGYTKTSVDFLEASASGDWGNGLKLEYGYEVNRIVGLNVSYGKNKDSATDGVNTFKLDGSTFKLDTDIGYKFILDSFNVKPYAAIGIARYNEEVSIEQIGYKWNENSLILGFGVRGEIGRHIYSDIRFDYAGFDGDLWGNADFDQFSWTVGYLF
ncbi:porin family protein [Vibrio sp. SCSIO 43135]|uniref:porin family protein n=1 Tax=Vibrio sp. SCSIO 43135 TaxID=2819096 RepID=UPI0020761EF7|nr:porin family protein [Vibrio sp. SCSIO 43135]USD40567.1 porin family protein [Vibrio sp. SCSIO 43135]